MVKQESTTWNSESDDDDSAGSQGYGSSRNERPAASFASVPRTEQQPASAVARASLEGMIWQQNENSWRKSGKFEKSEKQENDDDDDEEEEDKPRPAVAPIKKEASDDGYETEESQEVTAEDYLNDRSVADTATDAERFDVEKDQGDEEFDDAVHPLQPSSIQNHTPATVRPTVVASNPVRSVPHPSYQALTAYRQPIQEAAPDTTMPLEAEAFPQHVASAEAQYRPGLTRQEASPDTHARPAPGERPQVPFMTVPEVMDRPPMPPTGPPTESMGYSQPPERPAPPFGYAPNMYPGQPSTEYGATYSAPVPRAEQVPVDNHHHGEPLAAVVGVGLVAEHFWNRGKHKKHEGQMEQVARQGMQQHQEIAGQHMRMQEQHRQFITEQQRQAAEMQQMRTTQERFAAAAPYALENAPSSQQPVQRFEAPGAVPHTPLSPVERPPQQRPEHMPQAIAQNGEQQLDQVPESPVFAPDQHVERSAWHNIVVDKHGHEVTGAMHYGQEFYRQREHEMLTDQVAGTPSEGTADGGGATIGGQTSGYPMLQPPYQQGQSALPSGMTNPALPTGQPTHVDPQHQLPAAPRKQVANNIGNPWFWLMLILVVAAFFTAALI